MPRISLNSKNMRLQELMDQHRMTFKELAEKIEVSPEWLSKVINGHVHGFRIRHLVCKFFKVTYESLWPETY